MKEGPHLGPGLGAGCPEEMYNNQYRDVETSQLKLEPTLYKQTSMETNKKLANSASEEFENLYKVGERMIASHSLIPCFVRWDQFWEREVLGSSTPG